MLTKKIFLASSSELESDRKEFEIFIGRKNKDWVNRGVFLELVIWEDFLDAFSKTRLQDEYDNAIRECDIFVMLFCTKVGKYTEEEFETAFGQFKATNKPLIYTYFKDAQITTGSADEEGLISLWSFKKKLKALGHFQTTYKNIDELKFHFNQQLDKLSIIEPPPDTWPHPRQHVRIFFLAELPNRAHCTSLFIAQNPIQPFFQFELGHVAGYDTKAVEVKLCSVDPGLGLGKFIEQFEEIIVANEQTQPQPSSLSPVRIVITHAPLPRNFYLWGHLEGPAKWHDPPKEQWGRYEPNKFWIISLALFEQTLPSIPVERFLLRVIQRASVLALLPVYRKGLPDRLIHDSTTGCLFDFTRLLPEAQYFTAGGFICDDCKSSILEADEIPFHLRSDFLKDLQAWLDPSSVAPH